MQDARTTRTDDEAHAWAQETLAPGSCYWVIKRTPDGRPLPKAQLHRLPRATVRTLDDMATDLASQIRQ